MPSHTEIGEFIWRIANHLRGDYEKNDNEDVILPFTLLRRLDCVLEKTRDKDKVREAEVQVAGKVTEDVLKKLLISAAGVPFYNRSRFSFTELLKNPGDIKENFGAYWRQFKQRLSVEGSEVVTSCHGLKATALSRQRRLSQETSNA